MAIFYVIVYFQGAVCSTFQTCILNSHKGHTTCGSMEDIQSATDENRQGKKKDRRKRSKEETTGRQYNGQPYYIGWP